MGDLSLEAILKRFKELFPDEEILSYAQKEISRGDPVLCLDGSTRIVTESVRPVIIERSYCKSEEPIDFDIGFLVSFESLDDFDRVCVLRTGYTAAGKLKHAMFVDSF